MKSLTVDPNGYRPSDTIERLHRTIDSGGYGQNYMILPREKNEYLMEKYVISEQERVNILRSLEEENYLGWELSEDSKHPKDVVHFFRKDIPLFQKGIEESPYHTVELYIKLTWRYPDYLLIIISFHEANQYE